MRDPNLRSNLRFDEKFPSYCILKKKWSKKKAEISLFQPRFFPRFFDFFFNRVLIGMWPRIRPFQRIYKNPLYRYSFGVIGDLGDFDRGVDRSGFSGLSST